MYFQTGYVAMHRHRKFLMFREIRARAHRRTRQQAMPGRKPVLEEYHQLTEMLESRTTEPGVPPISVVAEFTVTDETLSTFGLASKASCTILL